MKYKAINRIDQRLGCTCTGCAGSFSDEKCLEIANFIINSKKYYPPCVGSDGVIYVEVKSERF